MAFSNAQITRMQQLAEEFGADVLFGALCMSGMQAVTDMIADMIHDKTVVIDFGGMPSKQKVVDMAIDQVCTVFPDSLVESDELDGELKARPGESQYQMLIRGIMTQLVSQRPDLTKIVYQPR